MYRYICYRDEKYSFSNDAMVLSMPLEKDRKPRKMVGPRFRPVTVGTRLGLLGNSFIVL
jgi:hypothetical protein